MRTSVTVTAARGPLAQAVPDSQEDRFRTGLASMPVKDLKALCKDAGLDTTGTKAELIDRLAAAAIAELAAAADRQAAEIDAALQTPDNSTTPAIEGADQ